jgi:hypothetical protein
MKLGAARAKAPAAWRLVNIVVAPEEATFSFALDRAKLRQVRRREGRGRPGDGSGSLFVGRDRLQSLNCRLEQHGVSDCLVVIGDR